MMTTQEPFKTTVESLKTSISSANVLNTSKPFKSNVQQVVLTNSKPLVGTSAISKISQLPVATMKPFSVSLKLSIPTPPPSKTIQSAAILTLEELQSGTVTQAKIGAPNILLWNISNTQTLKEGNKIPDSQTLSEGDKSTSDINSKNKQNFFLSLENPTSFYKKNFTKYDEEAPIINVVDFAKQPGIDKKASENDLLKYIKSLVKEASMEKITQTLG